MALISKSIQRSQSVLTTNSVLNKKIILNTLGRQEVTALFKKEIQAIVLKEFLPKEVCQLASKRLLSGQIKDYTNAPGIGRVGIAYFETTEDTEIKKQYFDTAIANIELVRSAFLPFTSPIDLVRLRCDELWPKGAMLSRDKDKPMFAGICRALESGKDILPHEDKIERDDPSRCGKSFWGQIAINLYLQPCEEGGKLQMWNISLADEKYKSLCGDSYGISRDKLPPPDLEIKPDTGDLVLFNPTNLHAVEKVAKTRLSISCFMGCESSEDALKFWS